MRQKKIRGSSRFLFHLRSTKNARQGLRLVAFFRLVFLPIPDIAACRLRRRFRRALGRRSKASGQTAGISHQNNASLSCFSQQGTISRDQLQETRLGPIASHLHGIAMACVAMHGGESLECWLIKFFQSLALLAFKDRCGRHTVVYTRGLAKSGIVGVVDVV